MRNLIEFRGETNLMHGVVVTKLPPIPAPMERGEAIVIPGQDGDTWRGEDAYEPVNIPVEIWVRPRPDLEDVKNWLQGEGVLRINGDVNTWRARVSQGGNYIPCAFNDGWTNTVTFDCYPLRFAPERQIVISESPHVLRNRHPVKALPVIKLTLAGDAEIEFCGTEIELFGLTGEVWIDSERMECYTADGLANNHMRGKFPAIPPGESAVSWTGGVAAMTVEPRWRLR